MILAPVFIGALTRRRATTLFSFAAIALGVALGMAVQVVHEAALDEFGRGLRRLAGAADLSVVGPRGGFAEALYATLAARPEVLDASPQLEVETSVGGRSLPLLGVDALALARVTPALLPRPAAAGDRLALLADDAIFLSAALQSELALTAGDRLTLPAGSQTVSLRVAGDLPGVGEQRRLAVMDIAALQTQFALIGRLTRVDLRLRAGIAPAAARAALHSLLPAGVVVEAPQEAQGEAARLSRAYRVNLTMLAAMALITGGFLVFSGQALSVVRRRTEFAFLRAIGLRRRTLFAWLLGEGALLGLAGGSVGVALAYALAWTLLSVLGGDLGAGYFTGLQPRLAFAPAMSAAYLALGVLAGVAGAWLPAREAADVTPAQALKASDDDALGGAGSGHPWGGLTLLAASVAACALAPIDGLPVGGYLAIAGLLAGAVLLLPLAARTLARRLPQEVPIAARLARARLSAAPGHALVAAAGVLTSVALAAAMAIMVASFRDSVDAWLTQILPADLYLRAGPVQSRSGFLDATLQTRIAAVPGVAQLSFTRYETLRLAGGQAPLALIARPLARDGRGLPLVGAALAPPPAADALPPIWISEALHDAHGWRRGQRVELPLAGRAVPVRVAGVWRDYSRQTGALLIDLADYRRLTGDALANDAAITLAAGASASQVASALLACGAPGTLAVAYPAEIRALSLRIFDRTFAVTYLLEAVAVIIGLAGVAASFAALAAARRREFGMLRHLGLTRRQIGAMLALEGALSAGVGVLAGLLAGAAIALILIEVVNRQSFHWSMDLHVPWASLALFASGLTTLAALAAVIAGRQAMRDDAILAVREDW